MRFRWAVLSPPRPGNGQLIHRSRLAAREQQGCWAQVKKDGDCSLVYVARGRVSVYNRDGERSKWVPTAQQVAAYASLPGDGWYVFVVELMHYKTVGVKNVTYIHDVLVADDEYLVGTTFAHRQSLLNTLFPVSAEPLDGGVGYTVIDQHTWLAKTYESGFESLFAGLDSDEDEGLVLKQPTAVLQYCHKSNANDAWQWKVRRQS